MMLFYGPKGPNILSGHNGSKKQELATSPFWSKKTKKEKFKKKFFYQMFGTTQKKHAFVFNSFHFIFFFAFAFELIKIEWIACLERFDIIFKFSFEKFLFDGFKIGVFRFWSFEIIRIKRIVLNFFDRNHLNQKSNWRICKINRRI